MASQPTVWHRVAKPLCSESCEGSSLGQQLLSTCFGRSLARLVSHFPQSGISSRRINSLFLPAHKSLAGLSKRSANASCHLLLLAPRFLRAAAIKPMKSQSIKPQSIKSSRAGVKNPTHHYGACEIPAWRADVWEAKARCSPRCFSFPTASIPELPPVSSHACFLQCFRTRRGHIFSLLASDGGWIFHYGHLEGLDVPQMIPPFPFFVGFFSFVKD